MLLPLEPACNTLYGLRGINSNELRNLKRATHRAHKEHSFFHLRLVWEIGIIICFPRFDFSRQLIGFGFSLLQVALRFTTRVPMSIHAFKCQRYRFDFGGNLRPNFGKPSLVLFRFPISHSSPASPTYIYSWDTVLREMIVSRNLAFPSLFSHRYPLKPRKFQKWRGLRITGVVWELP